MREIACLAVALALLAPARPARCAEAQLPIVVWIAAQGADEDAVFPIAAAWVEELRILVVREEAAAPVDDAFAERALETHGAVAVAWHDAAGALRILFSGEAASERVAVAGGGTEEEGLYLRELIAARLAVGKDLGAALVTVPDEVVAMRGRGPAGGAVALEAQAPPTAGRRRWSVKIGAGYFGAAHFDDVLWWQQGIRFAMPAVRLNDFLQTGLELELGLPSTVGDEGRAWLEIRTVAASLGAELFLLRHSVVEIGVGLDAGVLYTGAVAFLPTGESASASHTTGHATAVAGIVLHPTPRIDIRFRFDIRYVLRPPSFGIAGEGDFGAHPWQPGGGVDLAFSLYPR